MNDIMQIPPKQRVHITDGPFDAHAFYALAVMEWVEGIHAGLKRIFVAPEHLSLVRDSGPGQALRALGWEFLAITIHNPPSTLPSQ